MSGFIPPVNAHSTVEIENSCNGCCTGCFPRRHRIKQTPHTHHKPIRHGEQLNDEALKTHKVAAPVLSESGQWSVEIDGVKHNVK